MLALNVREVHGQNPYFLIRPGLTLQQAAYNIAVLGQAAQNVPPYAYGINPYQRTIVNSGAAGYASPYASAYSSPYGAGYGGAYSGAYGSAYSGAYGSPTGGAMEGLPLITIQTRVGSKSKASSW